jgi:mannitol-specific phosphotransferase system IIBC component
MADKPRSILNNVLLNPNNTLYWIIIGMLIVTMYYTSVLVQEAKDESQRDRDRQSEQIQFAQEQNEEIIRSQNQSQNNATNLLVELINRQNLRGNATLTGFNTLLTELKSAILDNREVLTQLVQKDANLTKQQQQELIANLERIPDLQEQVSLMLDATYQAQNATEEARDIFRYLIGNFGDEYIIDENRQYNQSNFTESQLPIMQEKLDRLLNNVSSQPQPTP